LIQHLRSIYEASTEKVSEKLKPRQSQPLLLTKLIESLRKVAGLGPVSVLAFLRFGCLSCGLINARMDCPVN
jgi:hypothetical protein